jgi:hypothetical protein
MNVPVARTSGRATTVEVRTWSNTLYQRTYGEINEDTALTGVLKS